MFRFLWPLLAVFVLAGCATHAATSGRVVLQDQNTTAEIRITHNDRALIRDYFTASRKKEKALPPGLAKRGGALPPGLAKRDTLPPGLQTDPLPHDLEAKLSRLPESYIRVRVGHDIVLMDKRTRVVFDVAYGLAI